MNIGESHQLITQLGQDLAAETDPQIRAWYELESKLDPDYAIAESAMAGLGILATQLSQLAEIRTMQSSQENTPTHTNEELVEPDVEQLRILTPEEQLHKRIERKYENCYKQYLQELDSITDTKKSKREYKEKQARRNFTRRFADFSDITGDEHIALRADLLQTTASDIIGDAVLADEVFASSADYAERSGAKITADPNNFASIIVGSVSEAYPKQFENILRSIFSTRHNIPDFAQINLNLAHAAFEVLDNSEAILKIVRITSFVEPWVPSSFAYEVSKSAFKAFFDGHIQQCFDERQTYAIFSILNRDVTGLQYPISPKVEYAIQRIREEAKSWNAALPTDHQDVDFLKIVADSQLTTTNYDPVTVSDFSDGSFVDLGLKATPDGWLKVAGQSALFHKRMEQLAPYAYSFKAAKILAYGDQDNDRGAAGISFALSPSLTVDLIMPIHGETESQPKFKNKLADQLDEHFREFIAVALMADRLGISSYQQNGNIHMVYRGLYPDDLRKGVAMWRPGIPTDRKTSEPLQQLLLNYARSKVDPSKPDLENAYSSPESHEEENEHLRETIRAEQKRFIGRRPIQFSLPGEITDTGLKSVQLRYDPKSNSVISKFELDDGDVELSLDKEFRINRGNGLQHHFLNHLSLHYENLILKLVNIWACNQEVHTSEGIVSESSGNAANMGHFAYLRVRERDGRRYIFSETQAQACRDEQGKILTQESERLKDLDPTGQARNSTYVRENYDPSKPPLEVYYGSLD